MTPVVRAAPGAQTAPGIVRHGRAAAGAEQGTRCAAPLRLRPGVAYREQDTREGGAPGAACRPTGAPQRFYALTVPAGQRARITVAPTEPFRAVARVLTHCEATSCLTDAESPAPGAPVTLVVDNHERHPLDKIVTVSAAGPDEAGTFEIVATLEDLGSMPPPDTSTLGHTCAAARAVRDGDVFTDQPFDGGLEGHAACATPGTPAPLYYAATIPPGRTLRVAAARRSGASSDATDTPFIRLLASCAADRCLAASPADGTGARDETWLSYTNDGPDDLPVRILVGERGDAHGPPGVFDVSFAIRPPDAPPAPSANTTCATAAPVGDGDVLRGQDTRRATEAPPECLGGPSGPALFYAVTVPPDQTLEVRAVAYAPEAFHPIIRAFGSCADRRCVAGSIHGDDPNGARAQYVNTTGVEQRLRLAVGGRSGETGLFDLEVRLHPRAGNATCAAATLVTDGAALLDENIAQGGFGPLSCAPGRDVLTLYYTATVPADHTLTVETGRLSAGISVLGGCGTGGACLAEGIRRVDYVNEGASARDVLVAVSSGHAHLSQSRFDLFVRVRPRAPNATCATALRVTDGTTPVGQDTWLGREATAACHRPSPGARALYYAATVPPGETLTARVAPRRSLWFARISVLDGCGDAAACLTRTTGDGRPVSVSYRNTGAAPREVVIAVSAASSTGTGGGPFDLAVEIGPGAPLCRVRDVAASGLFSCAAMIDGTVRCWGANFGGELGIGTVGGFRTTPTPVPGLADITQVSAGVGHACARGSDGAAYCWGRNGSGQLGYAAAATCDPGIPCSPTAQRVPGLTAVAEVAAGLGYTCARRVDGTVWCWGGNWAGQLGDGTTTSRMSPAPVPGITHAVQLAAGQAHACAVLADGTARCWGSNDNGRLGDGTTHDRSTPVAVADLTGAVEVDPGGEYTCARRADGTLRCWGTNVSDQLGFHPGERCVSPGRDWPCQRTPAPVPAIADATDLSTGFAHTCVARADGRVQCWGDAAASALGAGGAGDHTAPITVPDVTDAIGVVAGSDHGCAVLTDRTLRCWGANPWGGLGDGTTDARHRPVPIACE